MHGWLDVPPSAEGIDPTTIPPAHRRFFLEAIEGLINADGQVTSEELDNFELFRQLLA